MKSIRRSVCWATVLCSVTAIYSAVLSHTTINAQEASHSQNSPSMNVQDLVERGRKLAAANKSAEAIVELTRAIEIDPNYLEAYYYRSGAFIGVDQPLEAIKDVEKAADLLNARGESDKAQVMLKFANDIREGIKAGDFNQ